MQGLWTRGPSLLVKYSLLLMRGALILTMIAFGDNSNFIPHLTSGINHLFPLYLASSLVDTTHVLAVFSPNMDITLVDYHGLTLCYIIFFHY